jgi:DNA-binding transcriptional LysR family regulator
VPALDIPALEIFRAVAREGSVTGAAEKLHRVQSNVSTRLRQLEDRLQTQLFIRRSGGWTLTKEGRTLLSYADRLIDLSGEAEQAMLGSEPAGCFRIGAMESTAGSRLPAVLSAYHQSCPNVQTEVVTDTAGGLLRRLAEHDVDVAFVAEPVDMPDICSRPVFQEELVLIAPASYPEIRDPAQFSGRTMIAFETGCAYRRYLQAWMNENAIMPSSILSLGSYLAILASVFAGTGFAVIPKSVLDLVGSKGQLRRYELPDHISHIRTLMIWRNDHASPKLDALMAQLPDFEEDVAFDQ